MTAWPRALRITSLALAALWLYGAIGFVRSQGVVQLALPRKETPPLTEHNLANYRWGPSLRASSYARDPGSHHHPLFLLDGRADPSLIEKWASAPGDRAPWIELTWREPRTLSRVVITHRGAYEERANLARYSLRCLRASGEHVTLAVRHNIGARATHPLPCAQALGVRIDFQLSEPEDQARVYEVEAWGR